MIKKLELCLMVVSVLLEIKFGHAQISVPKISIPMSKTAYIKTADMLDKDDDSLITRILLYGNLSRNNFYRTRAI